jgi:uncharacterized protein GlcG (DUF336 family)
MFNRRLSLIILIAAMCAMGAAATAEDILQQKNISLALANEAAAAALQFCSTKGWKVSVAVVDRAGQLKSQLRADGAGPHTLDSSRRKAYTSASLREGTSKLLEIVQKNPGAATLPMIDGLLILGGGLPIHAGDEVIGAIGIGGAPGGHLDDQCAEAGIAKIRDRLNP